MSSMIVWHLFTKSEILSTGELRSTVHLSVSLASSRSCLENLRVTVTAAGAQKQPDLSKKVTRIKWSPRAISIVLVLSS